MLEIYSRDRETDFEFYVFNEDNIKYKIKNYHDLDSKAKEFYRSLDNNTVIIDGIPLDSNLTKEQSEYIKEVLNSFKDKYKECKENYKPAYYKQVSSGNLLVGKVYEIPSPKHFKEFVCIKAYEALEEFYNKYKNKSNIFCKIMKKISK